MTEPNDSLPVREILTAAGPFIKSIVDTFIAPKLENIKKRFTKDYNKYYVPTEDHFSEYFHRTYKRVSIVNTLVFNNSQRFLKEIYLPLTIKKNDNRNLKFKIDGFPENLISKYEKILITDNAGMGKSTLMKKIFIDAIDSKKGVPILIELRRLSQEKKIIQEIQEQINSLEKDFDSGLLLELIKEGGFIILLDGFDEISLSDREVVTTDIQNFISKASNNKYILTSRPENALTSFGDFQEFKIEPLKKKEAYELLRKYDKQGTVSALLIKKLEETEMVNISEFLTNPLLVSLLFTAFQHKQTIPFKKYIFYRQVYDANFESHDLTKGDSYTHNKYTKLEIDDFHRVLRHIGFSCLKNNQRIEFSKDQILDLIRKAKSFCVDLDFSESDFLKDLLITVPLFSQDGNYYRWAHKSLQEYFASQFIYLDSKDKQSKILQQIYENPSIDKFINILDLYYDIDTKTFRNVILYDFLLKYENHYNTWFENLSKSISEKEVEFRKEVCFINERFVFLANNMSEDEDHKNLDNMFHPMGARISCSLYSPNYDKKIYCFVKFGNKDPLLHLLYKKNSTLVNYIEDQQTHDVVTQLKFPTTNEYAPHLLNGKVDDIFNSVENFEEVNKLILHTMTAPYKISSKEAFRLLGEIKGQINSEKSDNFLLEGL